MLTRPDLISEQLGCLHRAASVLWLLTYIHNHKVWFNWFYHYIKFSFVFNPFSLFHCSLYGFVTVTNHWSIKVNSYFYFYLMFVNVYIYIFFKSLPGAFKELFSLMKMLEMLVFLIQSCAEHSFVCRRILLDHLWVKMCCSISCPQPYTSSVEASHLFLPDRSLSSEVQCSRLQNVFNRETASWRSRKSYITSITRNEKATQVLLPLFVPL